MKKISKILAAVLAVVMLLSVSVSAANLADSKTELVEKFVAAEGPKVGNYSVDYRYFSPVKENDDTKYPLVVWLHGMGEGGEEGGEFGA